MLYSSDEIKPNLVSLDIPMSGLDDIALHSWREGLKGVMPEMKRALFNHCRGSCGDNCESLCGAGESVAWGLSQIRVNQGATWN